MPYFEQLEMQESPKLQHGSDAKKVGKKPKQDSTKKRKENKKGGGTVKFAEHLGMTARIAESSPRIKAKSCHSKGRRWNMNKRESCH